MVIQKPVDQSGLFFHKAEFMIKGWNRKKKETMIKGDCDEIKRLARGKNKHERQ